MSFREFLEHLEGKKLPRSPGTPSMRGATRMARGTPFKAVANPADLSADPTGPAGRKYTGMDITGPVYKDVHKRNVHKPNDKFKKF